MAARRSLSLPITLAIVMIVILVVLTVGWVLVTVMGLWKDNEKAGLYIALLSIGTTFIGVLLAGTIIYLVLTIKTINLNRRQSNFIDSVTHELKSPIASMKLYLQTLTRRQVSEEERNHFYRCMVDDLDRLDGLINQLLDAGRLEEGRIDADREDVFLDVLLRNCASTVGLHYRIAADVFQFELQPCTIRAWRVDLDILFRNLIDNAVKYASSEPAWASICGGRPTAGQSSASATTATAYPAASVARSSAASNAWGWNWNASGPAPGWGCTSSATSPGG